ncbi:PREDICTED: uncharacterized protein LOC106724649 [Myotis brandtii]|uniref:uncharacterized protein LOC106724649 n=1 Tax=Myotis brandtii TaxID=109478 RepID=UPI00070479E6|nr:PREDICTED: uncharacterized protein LOC106724649 [Myotis brandtii]
MAMGDTAIGLGCGGCRGGGAACSHSTSAVCSSLSRHPTRAQTRWECSLLPPRGCVRFSPAASPGVSGLLSAQRPLLWARQLCQQQAGVPGAAVAARHSACRLVCRVHSLQNPGPPLASTDKGLSRMGRASLSGMFQSVLWLADHWVILPSPQHSLAVPGDRQEGWGPVARFCRLLPSVDMARALFWLVQNVDSPGLWLSLVPQAQRAHLTEGPAFVHVSHSPPQPRALAGKSWQGTPVTLAVSKPTADHPLAPSRTHSSQLSWLGPWPCHPAQGTELLHRWHWPSPWRPFLVCFRCQYEAPLVRSTSGSAWGPAWSGLLQPPASKPHFSFRATIRPVVMGGF